MKVRNCVVVVLGVCMAFALAAPAHAGFFSDETGKNIYAVPKPGGVWVSHLTNSDTASTQGRVMFVETVCHRGVGVSIVAPQVLPMADHGVLTVAYGDDTYEMRIAGYQLGFCFVLDHWPSPWPIDPVYMGPGPTDNPMFIEWDGLGMTSLTPEMLFAALRGEGGNVSVAVYDEGGALLLQGDVN